MVATSCRLSGKLGRSSGILMTRAKKVRNWRKMGMIPRRWEFGYTHDPQQRPDHDGVPFFFFASFSSIFVFLRSNFRIFPTTDTGQTLGSDLRQNPEFHRQRDGARVIFPSR